MQDLHFLLYSAAPDFPLMLIPNLNIVKEIMFVEVLPLGDVQCCQDNTFPV